MKKTLAGLLVGLFLSIPTVSNGTLIDCGGGLIYDTDLNITWLKDANYAMTLGYDPDGMMTWNQAVAWAANVEYYDSFRNMVWNDWRLPSAGSNPIVTPPLTNTGSIDSELGHLYYIELGNHPYSSTINTGPFVNVAYSPGFICWFEDEYVDDTTQAWVTRFAYGDLNHLDKNGAYGHYAWLVRDGDVISPVPEPATLLFMSVGLAGLAGLRKRFKS